VYPFEFFVWLCIKSSKSVKKSGIAGLTVSSSLPNEDNIIPVLDGRAVKF